LGGRDEPKQDKQPQHAGDEKIRGLHQSIFPCASNARDPTRFYTLSVRFLAIAPLVEPFRCIGFTFMWKRLATARPSPLVEAFSGRGTVVLDLNETRRLRREPDGKGDQSMFGKWRSKPANRGKDRPQINRRDLLQGKFWKLIRPPQYVSRVMRYPRSAQDLDAPPAGERSQSEPKTLHGIVIEPVAPTSLGSVRPAPTIPVFRPPGAVAEAQFLAGCTRCNDCAEACPHDAIRPAPARLGAIAGTPTIEPDVAACMMCEDFPCIQACEPGVLTRAIPPVMGTAKVTEQLCLAYQGTTCTVCSERCPVDGAIALSRGKPTIDEATCVGCGVCRFVCPAPENAILLMPAFLRPPPPIT
ncbi:MAG: 4Fe-4S dicluster domain-containing protein, partial [Planctomycetes bacterium]|nr:4Fe-4S dicluster domain-containing protein [Planctomycetota bacterium]